MAAIKKYFTWIPQMSSDGKTQVQIYKYIESTYGPDVTVEEECRGASWHSHYQGQDSRRMDRLVSDDSITTINSTGNTVSVLDFALTEGLHTFCAQELADGATGTAMDVATHLSPTRTVWNEDNQVDDTVEDMSWNVDKLEQTVTPG